MPRGSRILASREILPAARYRSSKQTMGFYALETPRTRLLFLQPLTSLQVFAPPPLSWPKVRTGTSLLNSRGFYLKQVELQLSFRLIRSQLSRQLYYQLPRNYQMLESGVHHPTTVRARAAWRDYMRSYLHRSAHYGSR